MTSHTRFPLWDARWSPDAQWVAFHYRPETTLQKVAIARFTPGRETPESEWIPIGDGKGMDRRPAWSPDGNLLYFTSERDGFRCIWAQRLNRDKKPAGAPFVVEHFHTARRSLFNVPTVGELGLDVIRDRIVLSFGEMTGNIWAGGI